MGSMTPGRETKIPRALQPKKKKKTDLFPVVPKFQIYLIINTI